MEGGPNVSAVSISRKQASHAAAFIVQKAFAAGSGYLVWNDSTTETLASIDVVSTFFPVSSFSDYVVEFMALVCPLPLYLTFGVAPGRTYQAEHPSGLA